MKKRLVYSIVFAVLTLFLLAGQTAARGAVTDFSGTAVTFELDPGEWVYGKNHIIVNHLTHADQITATDPRLDGGVNYIVVYAKLDYAGNGKMWGTWRHVNDHGTWEGTYHGKVVNFWEDDFIAKATGVGGGEFAGQKIHLTNEFGSLSGKIIAP